MKVTEKKLEDGRIQLEALASTAEVAQAFGAAHYAFCGRMGVRVQPGQTPQQAAEEQIGVKDLDTVAQQLAVDYLVPFAVDKRNLCPAFPPKAAFVKPIKRGETFEFTLNVTPKPDYELESYDPVSVTVPAFTFDESQVDQELANLAESFATYEKCDAHPIGEGDAALLAIEASQGGKRLDNLCTDGRTYIMGMQLMPEEFESQLVGMTEGDVKDIEFTVPDMPEDAKDPFKCTVTVKELQHKVVPEVNDEFVAKNMPMLRDAAALRGSLAERMRAQAANEYNEMKLSAVAEELGRRFKGKIADEVYEAMRQTLVDNIRLSLTQQGVQFDQFVQSQGGEQQFNMGVMIQARQMLVAGYALDAVFRHEKMEITDDDIMASCRAMNPSDPAAARRQMEENGQGFVLRETAERLKANRFVLEHANVTVSGAPSSQNGEEAAAAK